MGFLLQFGNCRFLPLLEQHIANKPQAEKTEGEQENKRGEKDEQGCSLLKAGSAVS